MLMHATGTPHPARPNVIRQSIVIVCFSLATPSLIKTRTSSNIFAVAVSRDK